MSKACHFIDTSALFKRYIQEAGTDQMDLLFEKESLFVVSNLSVIEMISNLKRLVDVDKKISIAIYNAIKSEFFGDIANGIIKVEPVSSVNIVTAADMLDKVYISPIDSLQLAMAKNLKDSYENIFLVCSDKKLCSLAEKEGITVVRIG